MTSRQTHSPLARRAARAAVLLAALLAAAPLGAAAQGAWKYRVELADKGPSAAALLAEPGRFLSPRALERRARQGIAVDSTDLPPCPAYAARVEAEGVRVVSASRWNNTLVVGGRGDTAAAARVAALPFVRSVRRVWTEPDSLPPPRGNRFLGLVEPRATHPDYYGTGREQLALHRGDSLHAAGFRGEGMHVAVIDAGFLNADTVALLRGMRLLGARDFVRPPSDVYAGDSHGLKALSCLAARLPHALVGAAPEASYWLLRSEDVASEQPVEEDYWAAALEFADSAGVDLVSSSLGYRAFDRPSDSYRYRDLDGRTALVSRTAARAAAKGIVLVCSAGNEGADAWKKITVPADAPGVLAVGAVQRDSLNAFFSSVGPAADGRVKPDVMAVGVLSAVCADDGAVTAASGTSFAAPALCGAVACFWQACPWLTAREVVQAVRRAGAGAAAPDNVFGYGIPDLWAACRAETARHLGSPYK